MSILKKYFGEDMRSEAQQMIDDLKTITNMLLEVYVKKKFNINSFHLADEVEQ